MIPPLGAVAKLPASGGLFPRGVLQPACTGKELGIRLSHSFAFAAGKEEFLKLGQGCLASGQDVEEKMLQELPDAAEALVMCRSWLQDLI